MQCTTTRELAIEGRAFSLMSWFAALGRRLRHWHEVYRQRQALLALDERTLKDLGLSRADALAEGLRPFWHDGDAWQPGK